MKRTNLVSLSRRALQSATLFLAAASVTLGGELVNSDQQDQLIGQMVVSAAREPATLGNLTVTAAREHALIGQIEVVATREHALIGEMVVTASRLDSATQVADLGTMTVTAHRFVSVARNETSKDEMASL